MSTTFGVKIPKSDTIIEVAYRSSHGIVWTNPLARLLPNKTPVLPLDNTAQGIHTIGDIKREMKC